MKICSISARNFRTLEDFHLELRPNYCAISGRNNAGKSAVVRIIEHFFNSHDEDRVYSSGRSRIAFSKDVTQWVDADEMKVSVTVRLDRLDDSEVFFVVETYSQPTLADNLVLEIGQIFRRDETTSTYCIASGFEVDGQKASEILKKLRSASNMIVHNSTSASGNLYYNGSAFTEVLYAHFSNDARQKISDAQKGLQTRIKKAAKDQKDDLDKILGKLSEKYQVELSSMDRISSTRFPLEIKLTDKSVEVPLNHWGSGTQNRTRVLISVLDAVRIGSSATAEDRSTPVFLVEEPESFLHPSAQAEFGQVLNSLAEEQKIQIIATTHSPYMLNQSDPSANVLLERRMHRSLLRDTQIKDTSGDDWMLPFAENLGIVPSEFKSWKKVFGAHASKVVLVEGEFDKAYFEFVRDAYPSIYDIPSEVEIIPYGGKDALKATPILQFMINKFGRVFITFDLDAKAEIRPALERIGLCDFKDFCSIGVDGPGSDCIEGLLPPAIKQAVFSKRHELVTALGSQDSKARNSAKNAIKGALLEEFKSARPPESELSGFKKMFTQIGAAFK